MEIADGVSDTARCGVADEYTRFVLAGLSSFDFRTFYFGYEMKLLIFLILAGKLLTVTAPQSIAAPNEIGVLAQMYANETTVVYAHSNLSGTLFYDLAAGDTITAIYSDGSVQAFEVVDAGAYAARSTTIAQGEGDFDLRVNASWMPISDVMAMYSAPDGITLFTCYAASKGLDVVTGRLFVELVPIAEVDDVSK